MGISNNNKRIAINTLFLYGRMLFCMFVSFFTTRIVLQALGVVDYGLVNAIGGIVGMFVEVAVHRGMVLQKRFLNKWDLRLI